MVDISPSGGHLAFTGYPPGVEQTGASNAAQAFYIASGTAGTSHSVVSRRFRGFTPGQPFFLSFLYKADRTTGAGILALKARINWYGSTGLLTPTDQDINIDADVATTFTEKRHIAPAGAVEGEVVFIATPAASPMQHDLWIAGVRLARTEAGAEITSVVEGAAAATFSHSSVGVADSGQFPRTIIYKLLVGGAEITSGVTWTYLVRSGTVNGFTTASGAQSMSSGGLVVSSLGTNSAIVEVYATYNGVSRFTSVTLTKTFAAPDSGGGGGGSTESQNSGFGTVTSSSFATISNVLNTTLPAGKTQIDITVSLGITPTVAGPAGANNLEFKVQRNISGTWTDVGTGLNSDPDPNVYFDTEFVAEDGSVTFTINNTGLTASASYEHRVQARYTTGSSNHQPFGFYGTIQTSIP